MMGWGVPRRSLWAVIYNGAARKPKTPAKATHAHPGKRSPNLKAAAASAPSPPQPPPAASRLPSSPARSPTSPLLRVLGMEAEAAAKRARETAEDTVAAGAGAEAAGEQAGISAVIPGWFSEISPMWPGACPCCSCSLLPPLLLLVPSRAAPAPLLC